MAFKLTKKQIVKEILKCGKDAPYFINNYCRISHPMKGLIQFKTYPYQDDLLNDWVILIKSVFLTAIHPSVNLKFFFAICKKIALPLFFLIGCILKFNTNMMS